MMKRERGNILFLILLAVVLFAALSYAVTSSMRGGGTDASGEKAAAQTAELMNYFAQMDAAVQRMMLTGGVKDYELNFFYQTNSRFVYGAYDNTNCTDSRCRVFDPAGGAVSGQSLSRFTKASLVNRERVLYLSVPGVGTSATDVIFAVQGVSNALCREVNKRAGIGDIIYSASWNQGSSTIMYQFALPVGPIPDSGLTVANVTPAVGSVMTFCTCVQTDAATCEAASYDPMIWHVLVAR